MCIAQGHSNMTIVPRLGIEDGTPGFKIPTLTTLPRRFPDGRRMALVKMTCIKNKNIAIWAVLRENQHDGICVKYRHAAQAKPDRHFSHPDDSVS